MPDARYSDTALACGAIRIASETATFGQIEIKAWDLSVWRSNATISADRGLGKRDPLGC